MKMLTVENVSKTYGEKHYLTIFPLRLVKKNELVLSV